MQRLNGRMAMLGFAGTALAELKTQVPAGEQLAGDLFGVLLLSLTFTLASIFPKFSTGRPLRVSVGRGGGGCGLECRAGWARSVCGAPTADTGGTCSHVGRRLAAQCARQTLQDDCGCAFGGVPAARPCMPDAAPATAADKTADGGSISRVYQGSVGCAAAMIIMRHRQGASDLPPAAGSVSCCLRLPQWCLTRCSGLLCCVMRPLQELHAAATSENLKGDGIQAALALFDTNTELLTGRVAMIGFAGLLITEAITGKVIF